MITDKKFAYFSPFLSTKASGMRSNTLRRTKLALLVVVAIAVLIATFVTLKQKNNLPLTDPNAREDKKLHSVNTPQSKPLTQQIIDDLIASGWEREAAEATAALNQDYFSLLYKEKPEELQRTVGLLGRLGNLPYVQIQLVRHPELAGLLAGSRGVDENAPHLILRTLSQAHDRSLVLSLYALSAAPSDSVALAKILDRDRELIVRLCRRGAWDAIVWFDALPADRDARRTFHRWLGNLFDTALRSGDDEALDRTQTLLAIHAPIIRRKLDGDAEFRRQFEDDLWPMFVQILNRKKENAVWGNYVFDPRVWELLSRYGSRGARLFESHGAMAVDLLLDETYGDCFEPVLAALKSGDERTIEALYDQELRQEPLFIKLLQRPLPSGTLAKALRNLTSNRADAPRRLRSYQTLSDAALIEELGPPPDGAQTWLPGFGIYYLAKKHVQGREVTGLDVALAAVDIAESIPVVKGASKITKPLQKMVKSKLAQGMTKKAAQQIEKASSRELFPWMLREAHSAVRNTWTELRPNQAIEITQIVRFTCEKRGMRGETYNRLTRLQARILMRADRRVVINLSHLNSMSKQHVLGRYLRQTAKGAVVSHLMDTQVAKKATDSAASQVSRATGWREDETRLWTRHIAAWFLANAGREFVE